MPQAVASTNKSGASVQSERAALQTDVIGSIDLMFRAFSDRTRLRILFLLHKREFCVGDIVDILQVPQPRISRHLAYLRKAGIVAARREGKWMHYKLMMPPDQHAAQVLKTTLDSLAHDPRMKADRQRLQLACCGPKSLVNLIGAPLPVAF